MRKKPQQRRDAAPVARLKLAIEAYGSACERVGRNGLMDISHPFRVAGLEGHDAARRKLDATIDSLYAHPEDAPRGPWSIGKYVNIAGTRLVVRKRCREIGSFESEAEAAAVRDVLNRLKGDET